jgi:uncharacterized protein (TIGR02391 family)
MAKHFTQSQLEAIAGAMRDTDDGLTGSEIAHLLASCKGKTWTLPTQKRHRLYNALALSQNERPDRLAVLAFIRKTMKPERFARAPERFEPLRANLNLARAFAGLCVTEAGEIGSADKAATLSEAKRRAEELRADLGIRGAHPDVLRFCREELLADNYFHAMLEAIKSVGEKIRDKTGLADDGGTLIDRALGGAPPMLAINILLSESEISEQRGFANLVRGAFGMFRNPTAHARTDYLGHEQGRCRGPLFRRVADSPKAR